MICSVTIKHSGKSHSVDVDTSQNVETLQATLFSLTGVPPAKQKLLTKNRNLWKGPLKASQDLSALTNFLSGAELQLIGKPESKVTQLAPPTAVNFVEDLPVEMRIDLLPSGLYNNSSYQQRNICYMNSSLQCLKAANLKPNSAGALSQPLQTLFDQMEKQKNHSVEPSDFWTKLKIANPAFAALYGGATRAFMQQDADEFFSTVAQNTGMEDQLNISAETLLTNAETKETSLQKYNFLRLVCPISNSVNDLETGLKLGQEVKLEKHSEELGKNVDWSGTLKYNGIKSTMVIQLERFYWKPTPDNPDHRGINCKIRRRVKFPLEFDFKKFCTDDLKAKIDKFATGEEVSGSASWPKGFAGEYELFGVVTHKGSSSQSGHYISFVKQEGPDSWVCFDDDDVEKCRDEDIMKLDGQNADYHIAYMLYYRMKGAQV